MPLHLIQLFLPVNINIFNLFYFQDDNDEHCHDLVDSFNQISTGSEADTEGSIPDDDITMGSLPMCEVLITQQQQQLLNLEMPVLGDTTSQTNGRDQIVSEVEVLDCVDGIGKNNIFAIPTYIQTLVCIQ